VTARPKFHLGTDHRDGASEPNRAELEILVEILQAGTIKKTILNSSGSHKPCLRSKLS